jgi:hypothetical protein
MKILVLGSISISIILLITLVIHLNSSSNNVLNSNNCLSDKGYYCDKNNIIKCPLGTLCPNLNMKEPSDCPFGYYCETTIDNPKMCPIGFFCPNICK